MSDYRNNVNVDDNIFTKYWGDSVKKYKFMADRKSSDLDSLSDEDKSELEEYKNISNDIWLNKKGCSEDVFRRCPVNRSYLLNSGTLIEYYQIMKASQMMFQYEKDNNFEYDFVIRSRLDVILTSTPNFDDFPDNMVYTYRKNMVWIMRRSSALLMLPLIYSYGDYDDGTNYTWDSESQFLQHLKYHGLSNIDHWNEEEEITLTCRHLNLNTLVDGKINPNLSKNIRMFVVRSENYPYFTSL